MRKLLTALVVAVAALVPSVATPATASAATTTTDVVVYAGQLGADTYEQTLNGVLYTEDQIGLMADRILYTEEEIGQMADRIVYVTEISENNAVEVIYMVTTLALAGTQGSGYLYEVALTPVAALPTGW